MSCVIGLVEDGQIYFGADGYATTEEGERRPIITKKLLRNKDYLIGYTGSVRTGQLINPHDFDAPDDINDLSESLRKHLYARGCVATNEMNLHMQPCNFLIAYKHKFYEILMDFQLNEVMGNFTAIGSGAPYAMGAMHILIRTKLKPVEKLELALKAASTYHTTCGPPFDYEYV
jgi:ATP-dependent protease HslVU (ClpYQ) peptidase subunit